MAISITWGTKVINIPKTYLTLVSGTFYTMDTDALRKDLKDLEDDEQGMAHPDTHRHNVPVTIAGVTYARTIEIINGYTITFEDGQYTVQLNGSNNNFWDVGGGILNQNQVQVIPTNSAGLISITSGSGVTEQDKLDIADRVWDETLPSHVTVDSAATAMKASTYRVGSVTLDTVNGSPGTGWPLGTHHSPVDNLTDALTIMSYGKVDELILCSDLVVGAGHDISNIVIRTIGRMGIDVTLTSGCVAQGTTFRNVNLSGTLTEGNILLIEDCSIGSLYNFSGVMNNVAFLDNVELSIYSWANIIQGTAGGNPTNEVELLLNGASINVSQWTGNLKLMDKEAANRSVINCTSGNIIIDSTCIAGTIQLLGVGQIEADNSGAGCTVDSDGFIAIESVKNAVWEHADALFLGKVVKNKKELKKTGSVWEIIIYDDDSSTPILQKDLKDVDGNNITDLEAGALAQELKTSV